MTRFFSALIIYSFLLVLAIVSLNLVADPYGIFHLTKNPPFKFKTDINNVGLRKEYSIFFIRPDGLLLGNSQVAFGLDPDHPALSQHAKKFFNAARPISGITDVYRLTQHARSLNPVSIAVVGIDVGMFVKKRPFFKDNLIMGEHDSRLNYFAKNIFKEALFSATASANSLISLFFKNQRPWSIYPAENGLASGAAYQKEVGQKGHHKMFLNAEKKLIRGGLLEIPNVDLSDFPGEPDAPSGKLRSLLKVCRSENIRLALFINPSHARNLEIIRLSQNYRFNEDWKRSMVRFLAEENSRNPGRPVPLWDFSGYNVINTDPVPKPGDKETQMKYFWEGVHYKKVVGNMILDRIFEYSDPERIIPDDFGVRIDAENIESHLENLREQQSHYIETHLEEIEGIWARLNR